MDILKNLIGKHISDIQISHGQYFALSQRDEKIGNAQNLQEVSIQLGEYSLTISNPISISGQANTLMELIGRKIMNVQDDGEQITFYMDENTQFQVNLKPEKFVGPEAMSIRGPNDLIVVWN